MEYEINPCTGNATTKIANGSPMSISITAYACNLETDPWSHCDKVAAKATIYFADSNIQVKETYWTTWYSSHTEFVFDTSNWKINKTGNYTMRLYVKSNDTTFPTNYTDINFQVINKTYYDLPSVNWSNRYVWYGDCISTGEVGGGVTISANNSLTQTLEDIENEYGWTATLIWILVMIAVAIVMWFFTAEFGSSAGFGAVIIVELCLLVVGMYLGFIPVWILWVLLLIGTFGAAYKIYKLFGGG
jgi:hypothetical protein